MSLRFSTVEISGTTYRCQYSHNSVAEIEELAGKGIVQMFGMSIAAGRYLLYAALVTKYKTVTLRRAGELLDEYADQNGNIDGLVKVLFELLQTQGFIKLPKPPQEGEPKPGEDGEGDGEAHAVPPQPPLTTTQSQ